MLKSFIVKILFEACAYNYYFHKKKLPQFVKFKNTLTKSAEFFFE